MQQVEYLNLFYFFLIVRTNSLDACWLPVLLHPGSLLFFFSIGVNWNVKGLGTEKFGKSSGHMDISENGFTESFFLFLLR